MNEKPVLLICEDERVRRILREALHDGGRAPEVASSAKAAIASGFAMAGVVVFAALGGFIEPRALVAEIRRQVPAMPVIGVFADEEAEESGLGRADIFFLPLRLGGLLDRVQRYRRGLAVNGMEGEITIGRHVLLPGKGALVCGGEEVSLTEKERTILRALNDRRGQTVSRKALLEQVWGYAEGIETHTLETHIYRLRQKIEQDPAKPVYLITEEAGYRLV